MNKKERAAKLKQAIDALNDIAKIRLAASPLHGVGVFAMRDIKKGETLNADAIPMAFDIPHKDFKKLNPEVAALILERWPGVVAGSHFLYPDCKMVAYMNHSDTPNYDGKTDKALKKIKAGEELTEDYRTIEGWETVYPWLVDSK